MLNKQGTPLGCLSLPRRTSAFFLRSRRRGLAWGSTRPTLQLNENVVSSLDRLNFARESSPLSAEEAMVFRVYALDSTGNRQRVQQWFTASPDRTLRLMTHAGLVLTRKERNRLQHALEGNTARHTDWLVRDVLASLDPLITEGLEQDCWQGNDE